MTQLPDHEQQDPAQVCTREPECSSRSVTPISSAYERARKKWERVDCKLARLEEEWEDTLHEMLSLRTQSGLSDSDRDCP
jgi:hypothetical protein